MSSVPRTSRDELPDRLVAARRHRRHVLDVLRAPDLQGQLPQLLHQRLDRLLDAPHDLDGVGPPIASLPP